jgi:hypothetical protein
MASPPITIGELTDVPTFDSPIASPWAQEVSRRVAHRFASTGERDAKYPANVAGAGAICVAAGVFYVSNGTVWLGRLRVAGTILVPGGPGPGGGIIPGQVVTTEMCRVTVPIPGTARLDLTAFLSGDGPWSGRFYVRVNGADRFLLAADSASSTTLDAHPYVAVAAGDNVAVWANYGTTGTGNYTWYTDPANFQFYAECGQT